MPTNILVTGGCGFIGSNFVNYIFTEYPNVTIVNYDKLILNSDAYYVNENVRKSERYTLVTGDIRNRKLVADTLNKYEVCYCRNYLLIINMHRLIRLSTSLLIARRSIVTPT